MNLAATLLLASTAAQTAGPTPLTNPGSWITSADYPAIALRANEEGAVGFALDVGADGRVRSCTITASSGSPALDERTCSLIVQRARFSATFGIYRSRVLWKIPRDLPQPVARSLVSSFIVEMDGRMTNCAYDDATNVESEVMSQPTPCDLNSRTTPFLDPTGKPVRKRVRIRRAVEIDSLP